MANPSITQREDDAQQRSGRDSLVEEATDPICGMHVDPEDRSTDRTRHQGKIYYFCSSDCREQFEASPDDFLD